MRSFKAPVLLPTLLMGDDPFLLAELSALMARKCHYLPVIDGPRMGRPDAEAEVIRRNNAVVRAKATIIVMANLSQETSSTFSTRFPANMTLRVQVASEVTTKSLGGTVRSGTPSTWGRKHIAIGLLKALRKKVPITFTDEEVDERFLKPEEGHLVVCEEDNDLTQVIAANYAYALGAGLLLIKSVAKEEAVSICEAFYVAYDNRSQFINETLNGLRGRLRTLLGDLPLDGVTGVTFISKEIPWGFAFHEIPTTHLFSYPDLGIAIINGVAAEQDGSPKMRIAAVIDPATIPSTEVETVAISLATKGMFVRGYRGKSANVNDISRMLELFPYDLLLIATHCGDSGGWRETYEYQDSAGRKRRLILDTALGVSSVPGRDKLEVVFFQRFVSLDGIDWEDKEGLKNLPIGTAINDFYQLEREERRATSREKIDRVVSSAAMSMYDGNLIVLPKTVADNLSPVILNNACTSWHRLAGTLMFGNARAYIGTVFPVVGAEAEEIAHKITDKHFGKPLAVALWRAQNDVYGDDVRRPYVMVGVHYQRLSSTYEDARGYLRKRLSKSLNYWQGRLAAVGETSEDKAETVKNYVDFLSGELGGLNGLQRPFASERPC